jgi:hypothetical protein
MLRADSPVSAPDVYEYNKNLGKAQPNKAIMMQEGISAQRIIYFRANQKGGNLGKGLAYWENLGNSLN